MDQKKIGKFIALCRKEKGLTQAQIAERFGISNRAVSKWENGISCPDASIMIELCDVLGISVTELLSGERLPETEEYKAKVEESTAEMQKQLKHCKRRIIINNVFLLFIAVISAFTVPWALIFIVFVAIFRDYYLFRNAKALKTLIMKSNSRPI